MRANKKTVPNHHDELIREIVERRARQHSTAVVLFHQAVAERLGLGPSDHKCLDLMREHSGISSREEITASKLAAITGLTTGAMTGVVARLEQAGFVRREPDPHDQRRQLLYPAVERAPEIHAVFVPLRKDAAAFLEDFDTHQLTAIAEFLKRMTELVYHHASLLRAQEILRHQLKGRDFHEQAIASGTSNAKSRPTNRRRSPTTPKKQERKARQ